MGMNTECVDWSQLMDMPNNLMLTGQLQCQKINDQHQNHVKSAHQTYDLQSFNPQCKNPWQLDCY